MHGGCYIRRLNDAHVAAIVAKLWVEDDGTTNLEESAGVIAAILVNFVIADSPRRGHVRFLLQVATVNIRSDVIA